MDATRAPKGGKIGMNGYFYKGGQYLPNTTLPPKDKKQKRVPTGKREIEPYIWVRPERLPEAMPGERLRAYDGYYHGFPGRSVWDGRRIVDWEFTLECDAAISRFYYQKGKSSEQIVAELKKEFEMLREFWRQGKRFRAIFEDEERRNITREVYF